MNAYVAAPVDTPVPARAVLPRVRAAPTQTIEGRQDDSLLRTVARMKRWFVVLQQGERHAERNLREYDVLQKKGRRGAQVERRAFYSTPAPGSGRQTKLSF